MIIDSHAHYSRFKFEQSFPYLSVEKGNGEYKVADGTRNMIFSEAEEIIGYIEPAIEFDSNEKILSFCKNARIKAFPAVGVHPTRTWLTKWKNRKQLYKYSLNESVIAIGETGLDYHYDSRNQHKVIQLLWFNYQIELAHKRNLPLILHIRKADKDAIRMLRLKKRKIHGGVVHCFCGDAATAEEYLNLGLYIGIGGALLQNNETSKAIKDAVKCVPLNRILVETDCPYVLPDFECNCSRKRMRKIRNTSLILPQVIKTIAGIKNVPEDVVEKAVYDNTVSLFRIQSKMQ